MSMECQLWYKLSFIWIVTIVVPSWKKQPTTPNQLKWDWHIFDVVLLPFKDGQTFHETEFALKSVEDTFHLVIIRNKEHTSEGYQGGS